MNQAHIHLLLNHLPVAGLIAAIIMLSVSLVRDNRTLLISGLVSIVLSAVLLIPVFLTGEGAEEVIESIRSINAHDLIEEHEDAAKYALWFMQALGVIALALLIMNNMGKIIPRWTVISITLFSLFVLVIMTRVAWLGGEIRHTEIRSGFSTQIDNTYQSSEQDD